jgi:hypothetical protein
MQVMFQTQNFCYSPGCTALQYVTQLPLRQLISAVYKYFLCKLFYYFFIFAKRIKNKHYYEIVNMQFT